jgi:putative transposase
MTQGKIERWHRSLKNRILLEHYYYYLPDDLERAIGEFVTHYKEQRYHESLNNLTPADVWLGRGQAVLNHRHNIKQKTLQLRKRLYFERKAV